MLPLSRFSLQKLKEGLANQPFTPSDKEKSRSELTIMRPLEFNSQNTGLFLFTFFWNFYCLSLYDYPILFTSNQNPHHSLMSAKATQNAKSQPYF
jgi:hypothetical protein